MPLFLGREGALFDNGFLRRDREDIAKCERRVNKVAQYKVAQCKTVQVRRCRSYPHRFQVVRLAFCMTSLTLR
jgi:hypothetical protein